jgi:hypothetical protein
MDPRIYEGRQAMTDAEYTGFLQALGRKHLRPFVDVSPDGLKQALSTTRLWKLARQDMDPVIIKHLASKCDAKLVEVIEKDMRETGILDALDDAPSLVFGGLRRSVIPQEDIEFLKRASFDDDEIEVMLITSIDAARHIVAQQKMLPSEILTEATDVLSRPENNLAETNVKKKGKKWNGWGKILGGSVTGLGNALIAAGLIAAPNPAVAATALASAAIALSGIWCGIGDLRGE